MAQELSATTIFASFQQYLDAEQDKREVSCGPCSSVIRNDSPI